MRNTPDYLAIGHVSKDLLDSPRGFTPGGTALYSALTAQRLGLQAAIVTACAPEDASLLDAALDAGVWVQHLPSEATTTFRNVYDDEGHRTQTLHAHARQIGEGDVPAQWRGAAIVHLGPVAQELEIGLVGAFPSSLLGVTPQGWMRRWDGSGRVAHSAWPIPQPLLSLPDNAFLVLSVEDLGSDEALLVHYAKLAPLVGITHGPEDAYLCRQAGCTMVPAFVARPVDPTGAGDVFSSALFVRYRETGDLAASARFAHAAAACNIEGPGIEAIPDRAMVERRAGIMRKTTRKT